MTEDRIPIGVLSGTHILGGLTYLDDDGLLYHEDLVIPKSANTIYVHVPAGVDVRVMTMEERE